MVEFTISKAKVGPITKRYTESGEYQEVERENEDGIKRVAVLGLDNSHSADYKVAYASDPLIVIQGGRGVSHEELKNTLQEYRVWEKIKLTPIEFPDGIEGWKCGFKSLPERVNTIKVVYKAFERELDDHQLLGDEEQFTVYL